MFILSPLLAGAALVWMALCGCALLSGPHLLHKLLCSRSWGAARRVQGEAGSADALDQPARAHVGVISPTLTVAAEKEEELRRLQDAHEKALAKNSEGPPLPSSWPSQGAGGSGDGRWVALDHLRGKPEADSHSGGQA